MFARSADALLDRLQTDESFAVEIDRLARDRAALEVYLAAEGFEVTDEEVREAFLERYGDQLSPAQLEAISSGFPMVFVGIAAGIIGALVGGGAGFGIAFGAGELT